MTGSVANASAASGTEVGYPNGHLGHLKPEEQEALESFKTYLAEKGYYKPGPPASHDEQTLLYVAYYLYYLYPCVEIPGAIRVAPRLATATATATA